MILTAAEQAAIAADMLALFPETALVSRATDTRDVIGGRTQSWATAATVPCRVHATPGGTADGDVVVSSESQDATMYRVAFPIGTDLRLTDRVLVMGLTLAVTGLDTPTSLSLELVARCTRSAA